MTQKTVIISFFMSVALASLIGEGVGHGQPPAKTVQDDGAILEDARFPIEPSLKNPHTNLLEPSWVWHSWKVAGPLPQRELDIVRAFLAHEVEQNKVLDKTAREYLARFTSTIGYYLVAVTIDFSGNDRIAVLHIEPATWVRRVRIKVPYGHLWQLGTVFHVFATEIGRRMSLKAGSRLKDDPEEQEKELRAEAVRLETYLQNQGYFDACVEIRCKSGRESPFYQAPRCDDRSISDKRADVCQGIVELQVDVHKKTLYKLGKIDVIGNQSVSDEAIKSLFQHNCFLGFCLFSRFHFQTMKRDLDRVVRLYKRRGFPAVRVSSDYDPKTSYDTKRYEVDFDVLVNERRRLQVDYRGDYPDTLTEEKLNSLLTFNEEGSYDDIELAASANAIRRHLQSQGFFETNVTYHRERFEKVDYITFNIYPSTRLKVDSVFFEGNRFVSADTLYKVIDTKRSSFVSAGQLNADINRIIAHYRELGFLDASVRTRVSRSLQDRDNAAVLAAVVASGAASSNLYVAFQIEEGSQSLIEHVDFEFTCEHVHGADELAKVVSIKAGDPFDRDAIERGRKQLARFYFKKAHPQARITMNAQDRCEQPKGRVRYCICENNKVRIGKVLIQGNFKTDDWIIRDELGFEEGAELSLGRAEQGPQNLRTTGLFSAVQVSFVNLGKSAEDDINVLVRVRERHDYRLSGEVAGGWSSDAGFFGELGVTNPNLLGKGLRTSLRMQYGTQFKSVEGKFTAPRWVLRRFVLGLPWHFDATAFWRQEDTERFGILSSIGTSFGISKLFRRGLFKDVLLSLRYDFRRRNRNEPLVRGPGPSEDLEQGPVGTRTGAVGGSLLIDKRRDHAGRPNPLTPDAGFKFELSGSWAHQYLLSQDNFIKLGVGGQLFWRPKSLGNRVLVTNSVRYDHGHSFDAVVLPEVERFFAGGDTTVRGFDEDRLATEIIEEPLPPYGTVTQLRILPAGGNVRLIHNLDLQFNMWELGGAPVASAIFLDTGIVTNSLDGLKYTDFRHALGFALARWIHPFGSVSVEWAIPLDPQVGDDPRGRFHFNFGLLF